MGLDTVELIMKVEDHFGIKISDQEAEQISTIQDFSDVVYKHIEHRAPEKCISQLLFYRLRQTVKRIFELDVAPITPKTKLADVFSRVDAKMGWELLESELGLRMPAFYRTELEDERGFNSVWFKAREKPIPLKERTLGDLVNWIISINYEQLTDVRNLGSKQDVQRVMLGIMEQTSGVPIDELKLEHSMTSDLGMD